MIGEFTAVSIMESANFSDGYFVFTGGDSSLARYFIVSMLIFQTETLPLTINTYIG